MQVPGGEAGGLQPCAPMVPLPQPVQGTGGGRRAGWEPGRSAKGLPDRAQGALPTQGAQAPLTGFLGILDLHGDGLRGEGQSEVRCTEGGGGGGGGSDSGGG